MAKDQHIKKGFFCILWILWMTLQKFQNLTFKFNFVSQKTLEFYGQIVKLRIIVQLNILKIFFFENSKFLKKLHSKSMPIFFSAHHSFYPQNSCFFNKCVDFLPRNLTNFDQPHTVVVVTTESQYIGYWIDRPPT